VGASDQDNLNKLLKALSEVPELGRTARFRCVLCLIKEEGMPEYFEGTCNGRILMQPQGASGFGYDPVFAPDGYSDSFAQLGASLKARLSHRAKAMALFVGQQS
jgi:XTP/dITP diphosphohydrolase